ncbi:MAG: RNase J family beta-CASP ribonuclease [Candidatus Gracilibacteria bacterium]
MDKIDEWMNRAFDGKVEPMKSQQNPPRPTTPAKFQNSNPNQKTQGQPQAVRSQQARSPQGRQPFRPQQIRPQGQQQVRPQQVRPQQVRSQIQTRPPQQVRPLQVRPQQLRPVRPMQTAQAPQPIKPQGQGQQLRSQKVKAPQAQKPPRPQKAKAPQKNQSSKSRSPSQPLQSIKVKAKAEKRSPILPGKLKIIPLGGLNEVGKNMMVYEYEEDIIVVDMGLEFPSDDMLGIDYVIPDVSYLEENRKRIKGIIITHGHLDHIGGIPYILPKLDFPPVYSTRLTNGLIQKRIEEFHQEKQATLRVIDPDQPLKLGQFLFKFFRVAHSIPDSVGVVIETPIGKIVHTGDFKFDESLAGNQRPQDLDKMKALGSQNILALLSDSTNALKPGHTMSELEVGKTLENVVKNTKGRLIVASFSSLIGRIQQIIDYAQKYGRKIFVSGRSMNENIKIAIQLGFLKFPAGTVQDIKKYSSKSEDDKTLILTTGSQGESISALTRIASNEHPHVKIKKGDTVVLSSSPIIGNERAIFSVVNNLCLLGADVIHNQIMDVHTSGHAYQEELKEMIKMVRPKYFIPVHGEYFMRKTHGNLANECGVPKDNVIMLQNGNILLAEKDKLTVSTSTIETKYVLIDGLGQGNVGSQVQIDRQIMSENGALIVLVNINKKTKRLTRTPDVVSRGFVYMHETEEVAQQIAKVAGEAYENILNKNKGANRQDVKRYVKQTVDKYTHSKLERHPLIVPLIIEN